MVAANSYPAPDNGDEPLGDELHRRFEQYSKRHKAYTRGTKNRAGTPRPPGGDDKPTERAGVGNGGLRADEFAGAVGWLLDRGHHPVPLGRRVNGKPAGKAPWLKHLIGNEGVDADRDQIESWPARIARLQAKGVEGILNVGIRLPVGGVGIDVDGYDGKRGLETLSELEARLGALPPTFRVTARGFDCGSGIRLFRIAEGVRLRGDVKAADGRDGHVEIIQRHLRVVVVPPSTHPTGSRYVVYDERTGEAIDLPPPGEWAELPPAWVEHLRSDADTKAEATSEEVERFGAEHTGDAHPRMLAAVVAPVRNSTASLQSTRNAVRDALCQAAREARGGWYPWNRATSEIGSAAAESYAERDSNLDQEDFGRLEAFAVAKANGEDLDALIARLEERRAAASGWDDVETMRKAQRRKMHGRLVTRSYADVIPEKVDWLWPHWIPRGCVAMLEGDPGIGKSEMTVEFAAIVSSGRQWPEVIVNNAALPRTSHEPAHVILVGVEDDEGMTVAPRLTAAGADLARVHPIDQPTDEHGDPVPFVIPDDVDRLRDAVVELNAKLVVIDPITAFISTSKVKAGDDPSTRQALMPLVSLARDTGCAVLLVRHLNKAVGMSAKHRGSGTIGFTGITRAVMTASTYESEEAVDGAEAGGPTHAIACVKSNLGKEPDALGYRLESAPTNPDVPVVEWCGVIDGLTADGLVRADGAKVSDARKNAPVREEAASLIRELLADGPCNPKAVITKVTDALGCSGKTVKDAAARNVRVVKKQIRIDGQIDHWTWELPETTIRIRKDGETS